jgi:hypothetical protein
VLACLFHGREYRQPRIQAGDPQHLCDQRLRRDEPVTTPCRFSLVGDPDEGAQPASVAERQVRQIEQKQPGTAADGCAATPAQAVCRGQVQLSSHDQCLDLVIGTGRCDDHALAHCPPSAT